MAKERTKAGLKEQRRQELERQQRRRMLQIGIPLALAVIAILVLVGLRLFSPDIEGVVDYGDQARDHEDDVVIAESPLPPVGGVHSPTWQNCGIYEQPVESKYAIHAMEHGAVWLAYSPDLPAEDVAALRDTVGGRSFILMAPYPDLSSDVVVSAWGLQLVADSASDDRIDTFIDRYRLGPQTPEPGASCTGGVGTPIES